jgi:hypothetical protein
MNVSQTKYPLNMSVYPDQTKPSGRTATVSPDGSTVYWTSSNIAGFITGGSPPSGDFVPLGVTGAMYVSPGYV